MSLPFLLLKIALVAFFLVMFLRTSKAVWGIGLLTVTTAILLDTLLSTFSREEILTELGFFYYIIAGGLFAGAAVWCWGVFREYIRPVKASSPAAAPPAMSDRSAADSHEVETETGPASGTAFDRQDLYEQIKARFGPEDLRDLIFDLDIPESDVLIFNANASQTIIRLMDFAQESGQSPQLALAVERILTPVPAEILPRIEKITPDSPATVLRHYLLANFTTSELQSLAAALEIDWENLGGDSKRVKARNLLLYLKRRERTEALIKLLQEQAAEPD